MASCSKLRRQAKAPPGSLADRTTSARGCSRSWRSTWRMPFRSGQEHRVLPRWPRLASASADNIGDAEPLFTLVPW